MKLHIQGGRLVNPATGEDRVADVFIDQGGIVAFDQAPDAFVADQTIDAKGLLVLPGLVDLSARLREPGYEHRATLESELNAALAGGVTSIVLPPDTDPVLDEPGLVEMLKHRARQMHQSHVYPLGAMTRNLQGKVITEMAELTEAGCVAFSQAEVQLEDASVLLRCMQYARSFDYTLWLRPQDPYLSKGGVAASGPYASRLGLSGIPVQAETIALHTIFELQRSARVRLHLCRLSSAAGLELVRQAKKEGLPVTCDVSMNHVHLTDLDIGYFDSNYRFAPPLRSQRDREAIWQGLLDGTIDAICSDHTPVDDDDKLLPFAEAEPGSTGLELLLSLAIKWSQEQAVPLAEALAKVTANPAAILGAAVPASCGKLYVGADADLCLVDAEQYWTPTPEGLKSQGKHSPFIGMELPGRVKMTIVEGRVAYTDTLI
ncbi:MAG: dihydroorotase [Pigmentiphaga sp.]